MTKRLKKAKGVKKSKRVMKGGNRILSGLVFDDDNFKGPMNDVYSTTETTLKDGTILTAMQQSVKALQDVIGANGLKNIKYGDYQTILVPPGNWPSLAAARWPKEMRTARDSLAMQVNLYPVSNVDPTVPSNKCALLDAIVNYCFNNPASGETLPGVPMQIDVGTRSANDLDRNFHSISWEWEYGDDGRPSQLSWKMWCPYGS
jgi:hypothetical protein